MGQEIFPVMRGGAGMGQEKSMQGGGKDPILWPRLAPLPSLVGCRLVPCNAMVFGFWWACDTMVCFLLDRTSHNTI